MTMLENNRSRTGRCAQLPVMVRVQRQRSLTAYRPCCAIRQGTLFPVLNKPLRCRHCCDDDHWNGEDALAAGRIIDENGDRDNDRERRCREQGDDREHRCCDRDDWDDDWTVRCCEQDNWADDWMSRCCNQDDDDYTCSQENDEDEAHRHRCCQGADQHQAASFALWELRLYLDTHPCDTRALTMLRHLDARTDHPSYATAFLPEGRRCCQCDYDEADRGSDEERRFRWRWVEDPWPWEECLQDCCHGHA